MINPTLIDDCIMPDVRYVQKPILFLDLVLDMNAFYNERMSFKVFIQKYGHVEIKVLNLASKWVLSRKGKTIY